MISVRLFALCALSGVASAQETATLVHRPTSVDDVLLPCEPWHAVGASLSLRGVAFAIDGSNPAVLGVDTDADGEVDSRLSGQSGRVVLSPRAQGPAAFTHVVEFRQHARGWKWTSSGCLVARVGGQTLRLLDLDGNGAYSDFGTDALAVGDEPAATLLSRVIRLNGALMQLEILDDEREVRVTPFTGPTGYIDARSGFASTGKLTAAIVQDGDLSFDLAVGKEALAVPAGSYRLVSGLAVTNDESVRIRAGRMRPLRVDAGASVALAWGAPLCADFEYRVDGEMIVVEPQVNFYGRAGEEYFGFWPCAKAPHLSIRNRETGEMVQSGYFGGSCGGGLSRFQASVPSGVQLVVELDHERAIFGKITGSSHPDSTQTTSLSPNPRPMPQAPPAREDRHARGALRTGRSH